MYQETATKQEISVFSSKLYILYQIQTIAVIKVMMNEQCMMNELLLRIQRSHSAYLSIFLSISFSFCWRHDELTLRIPDREDNEVLSGKAE